MTRSRKPNLPGEQQSPGQVRASQRVSSTSFGSARENQFAPPPTESPLLSSSFEADQTGLHEKCGELRRRICSGMKWVRHVIDPDGCHPAHELDIWTLTGECKRVEVPYALLSKSGKLADHLTALGVKIEHAPGAVNAITRYLDTHPDTPVSFRVERTGWHLLANKVSYALGDIAYCANGSSLPVVSKLQFLRTSAGKRREAWHNIVRICTGNPLLLTTMCAGFASPLLHPLNHGPLGISIIGPSNSGKTTALRLARALYDSPINLDVWPGTANALAALLTCHPDLPLVFDELGRAPREVVADLAYRLTNSAERTRANDGVALQGNDRMRSVVITAGEEDIVNWIEQRNRQAKFSYPARFITLLAEYKHGVFDQLHGEPNGAALSNTLNALLQDTHGVAWRHYMRTLCRELPAIKAEHAASAPGVRARLAEGLGIDLSDEVCACVVGNFSFLLRAGIVALRMGVFPIEEREIEEALRQCLAVWHARYQRQLRAPQDAIIEEVRNFLEEHRDQFPTWSNFSDPNHGTNVGFLYSHRDGKKSYAVFPSALDELKKKYGQKALHAALIDAGLLLPSSGNRPTQLLQPPNGGSRISMYVFSQSPEFGQ